MEKVALIEAPAPPIPPRPVDVGAEAPPPPTAFTRARHVPSGMVPAASAPAVARLTAPGPVAGVADAVGTPNKVPTSRRTPTSSGRDRGTRGEDEMLGTTGTCHSCTTGGVRFRGQPVGAPRHHIQGRTPSSLRRWSYCGRYFRAPRRGPMTGEAPRGFADQVRGAASPPGVRGAVRRPACPGRRG